MGVFNVYFFLSVVQSLYDICIHKCQRSLYMVLGINLEWFFLTAECPVRILDR